MQCFVVDRNLYFCLKKNNFVFIPFLTIVCYLDGHLSHHFNKSSHASVKRKLEEISGKTHNLTLAEKTPDSVHDMFLLTESDEPTEETSKPIND